MLAAAFAQQASGPGDPVIRVTTTLVQVDALVTDSKGRPVSGLTREDFEVLQDGKPREIVAFQFVRAAARQEAAAPPVKARPGDAAPPPPPLQPVQPGQVQRTVAVVVDDLGISFQSMFYVRESLKKFIDRNVQPGDLVAILRTGGGMGAFQDFTTDKAMLGSIADRLRWNPMGRGGVSPFAAIEDPASDDAEAAGDAMQDQTDQYWGMGTLSSLRQVVAGLKEMPGRKSVVLFSEGIPIFAADDTQNQTTDSFRLMLESANRAGVSIYTIDPRGLQTAQFSAADRGNPSRARADGRTPMERRTDDLTRSQQSLRLVAADTGGLFFGNDNDISAGLARALDDQSEYYLIGYNPGPSMADKKFHKIEVRVRKPGLKVRSRNGFLGEEETKAPATPATAKTTMLSALMSPFRAGAVRTRLTCFFGADERGAVVQSALLIDGRDIGFSPAEGGKHKGRVDILVASFDATGAAADQTAQGYNITLDGEGLKKAREFGLTYVVRYKASKPGPYQVRVAVRDGASGKTGTAAQFLNIPDLAKGKLAMSGIMVMAPKADADPHPLSTPAARTFPRGREMSWLAQVYNPKAGQADEAKLESSVRVFRDGKPVMRTPFQTVNTKPLAGRRDIIAGGTMRLGSAMAPGEYVLQLVVRDNNAPKKASLISQWIDFRVAE